MNITSWNRYSVEEQTTDKKGRLLGKTLYNLVIEDSDTNKVIIPETSIWTMLSTYIRLKDKLSPPYIISESK